MFWATTTFSVQEWSTDLAAALRAWSDHIDQAHPKVAEVRGYRYNGGTTVVWQEGFNNFHDYQELIEQEDDVCGAVMDAVFRHAVPGTRSGQIWSDAL
jgi:hypothetical protein